jgi:hypothetical protein
MRVSGRPDQLFIHELSNSKLGQFAAEAGVLYSAKRQVTRWLFSAPRKWFLFSGFCSQQR